MSRIRCCYGCDDKRRELSKEVNCHSICEEYLKERKALDELNDSRFKQSHLESECRKVGERMSLNGARAHRTFTGRRR